MLDGQRRQIRSQEKNSARSGAQRLDQWLLEVECDLSGDDMALVRL